MRHAIPPSSCLAARRSAVGLALVTALFTGAPGAAPGPNASEPRVEATRQGDAIVIEAVAEVHASLAIAWNTLTDYERYAEFVPDLLVSRILSRQGGRVILEQKGSASVLFFEHPIEVTLEVVEEAPRSVRSHSIAGNVREMSGLYLLEKAGPVVRVRYAGRIVPPADTPRFLELPIIRHNVSRQFAALINRIDLQARAHGALPANGGGRKAAN